MLPNPWTRVPAVGAVHSINSGHSFSSSSAEIKPRASARGFKDIFLQTVGRASTRLYLDLLRRLLSLGLLGKRQHKYALLEACFDLVDLNTFRHFEAAFERAEATFLQVIVLLLFLRFFPLLTLYRQHTVGHFDLDVLFVHAG